MFFDAEKILPWWGGGRGTPFLRFWWEGGYHMVVSGVIAEVHVCKRKSKEIIRRFLQG